jgi:TP901 family phage tail tape measure protein
LADVNSNININFNTADALAQLRRLQAGLSKFHQSLAEGNLAAANAQKGLNAQLAQAVSATGKFSVSQTKVASSTMAFTTALEKNKLSLKEYYRYSMAAATANTKVLSKAFAQEREIINRARRDRVKSLQSQYIQMSKAQGGFIDAMKVMPRTLMMANGRFTELGTRIQYAAQRQQFLNQLLKQGSTQLLNFGKNTQWAGRQLMVGLTIPLMMLGGYASKAFRELEEATVKFRRVYGDAFTNDAEVETAVNNIRRLANEFTKYGVAVKDTVEMAATAAAAGFQGKALEEQVKTSTKLAVLGQVEQQQALETTISLQNAFGLSTEELASKINFLNAVENQTVLSIEDLTIAIPKAAPVIKQLGGSVEDLAFFMTAMKEGGINASEGANALKSGLASLINPTDKASKMLSGFGINIKGLIEANKGDIKGIVVGFARALDTLDPLTRARAIEQLFGKFQFARLSTLFQNVSKDGTQAARAFQLTGASVEELAILSEREMKKVEDAVGTKFQAAIEQFKQDIMPLGKAFLEAMTPIVKFFGDLFEKFNGLSDNTKKVITIITGIVAGLGPVLLMTFGLLANGIANLIKLFATIRGGIAKLNGQTNILGAGFNYVTQEQLEQQAASQALHNTHTRLVEIFNVEKTAAMQLAAAYGTLSSQMRTMAAQNPGLFVGGMRGAAGAVSKLPKGVKGYEDGVISVPGPKGAGDVIPAMVSPGEAIIPTKTSEKYRGLITAMFQDKVPGFAGGRLPWGTSHPAKQSGAIDIGMPKKIADVTQSRMIADQIDKSVKSSRFAKTKPTDFGTLMQPFSGRSFPIRGVGGVYRKPNGELVVVKPTMDEKTALAEVRATQIARDVHGLISPKQTIRTMLDPTDISGQRKLIVLESPYDPRIAAATGKFTKNDMITQLVASTLRADKDLQQANLSGNVLADVGTAGVFAKASGFRDYEKVLPGMGEMGLVNLLGVKGGAKKFFAQETSALASKMTPKQYESMIIKEIDKSLPKLRKLIDSWKLNPVERQVYENMYARLEEGKKVDWQKLHAAHVAAGQTVKKYEEGVGASKYQKVIDKQVSQFALGSFDDLRKDPKSINQIDAITKKLAKEATEELESLKTKNPQQYQTVTDLLAKRRISDFSQEKVLKYVQDEMVFKDGKYYDKKSILGGANVDSAGKTYDEVRKNVLYRLGVGTKNGEFSKVSKMVVSKLRADMSPLDKASGGWKQNVPKNSLLYKSLVEQEKAFKAENAATGKNDPFKSLKETMRSLGYTEKEIAKELRPELSHIGKTGEPGRGPEKWLKGSAIFDVRLLNNYMNASKRASEILKWNANNNNPLNLSPAQIKEFKSAASYMSGQMHPTNAAEVKLVRAAAQLDIIADSYLNKQSKKPVGFPDLGQTRLSRSVAALIDDRLGTKYYDQWRPRFDLASGPSKSQNVLVNPNREYAVDTVTGKITKLNIANTGSKPIGAIPDTGDTGDRRTFRQTPTRRVATAAQARAFAGRPQFMMPGKKEGDPTLSKNAQGRITRAVQEQQRLLKAQNRFTEKQIQDALSNYRKKKVQEELALANTRRKAELERQEIKNRQTRQITEQEKIRQEKRDVKAMRQEKVGRFSGGASMALGTAGMAAMMAGNTGAGMGLMGASAVAGMAPMFAGMGPVGWAVTGITAFAGTLVLAERANKKYAEEQSRLVDATSATTEKMAKIGEITNKVGASEIYARRRGSAAADRYTTGFERGKQMFGTTFLSSEQGKSIFQSFQKDLVDNGTVAVQKIAVQLAGYISDGILTAEQAHSIATQIGIDLNNTTLISQISGKLLDLVGPEGQNLLTDPLNVRLRLVQEQMKTTAPMGDVADIGRTNYNPNDLSYELSTISDYFDTYLALFTTTAGERIGATIGATAAQNLEFNQAQADSFAKYYDDQIAVLEKQKLQTTELSKQEKIIRDIKDLEDLRDKGLQKFRDNATAILDNAEKLRIAMQGNTPGTKALLQASETQMLDKYKGGPQELASVVLAEKTKVMDADLRLKINAIAGSGIVGPDALTSMINIFGEDTEALSSNLDVAISKQDPGKVSALLQMFAGFENKDIAKTLLIDLLKKDPKNFDKTASTIALMEKMAGKEINLEAFFEADDAQTKLDDLTKSLEEVEKIPSPINKKALIEMQEVGGVSLDELIPLWDQWENLPDETKKTVIQEYVVLYKTITEGDIDAEIARRTASGGTTAASFLAERTDRDQVKRELAAKRTMQQVNQDIASAAANKNKDQNDNGKKEDPYEWLLSRLKNVRNAAINAAGGLSELNKALAKSGTKSVKDKFVGLEQQLMGMKTNRQFIDWITGMDPKEQAKWVKTATKKNVNPFTGKKEKGIKVGQAVLSKDAQKYERGLDAAIVGDFNASQQRSLDNIKYQEQAYRKLIAAGYDNVTIQRILEDEYMTQQIALNQITKEELAINANLAKQTSIREKINSLIQNGRDALQQQANIKQVPEVIKFFQELAQGGLTLSSGALMDIIGDPTQLSAAIAAMEDYKSGAAGAADRLKEIVNGLNAIKENSNIQIVLDFVQKNLAQKAQAGFEAAQKILAAKRTAYGNLTVGELAGQVSKNPLTGKTTQVGRLAKERVDARFSAPGGPGIPNVAGKTLVGVQKQREDLAKRMQAVQLKTREIQGRYSAAQDELTKAQDNLENALDAVDKKYDDLVKTQKDKIDSIEEQIKVEFEDKVTALNKESGKLSNDLAIMDNLAEKINTKYDKQVEALQKVSEINQDIANSQRQQLDLADALSQGDIAAAARAAQEMRASSAESMLNAQMSSIEDARKRELAGLRGAETGMTREQITERQFQITQEIYKLENDPRRLELEKQIEAAQKEITRLEKERVIELDKARVLNEKAIADAQAKLDKIKVELDTQNKILATLEAEDLELESQETYLQSIVDEAIALDDSTGMTLEKWEETTNKLLDIKDLAEAYAIALAAAEESASNADASWQSILDTINAIPESVTTNQIINEIRNITENITRYITTIDLGSGNGNNNTGGCPTGFVKDASGKCVPVNQSTACPTGFVKDASGKCVPINQSGEDEHLKAQAEAAAKAAAEAAAKAAADAAAAAALKAKQEEEARVRAEENANRWFGYFGSWGGLSSGGIVPKYFAKGGLSIGTDTIPAMLTPGEFVMSKYAVDSHGIDKMKALNNGESVGESVYNYSINVNVKSDANPDEIARAVMSHIKQVDSRRLGGNRL